MHAEARESFAGRLPFESREISKRSKSGREYSKSLAPNHRAQDCGTQPMMRKPVEFATTNKALKKFVVCSTIFPILTAQPETVLVDGSALPGRRTSQQAANSVSEQTTK